ncbi:UDP-N-acetylmuramoyl-L-alanyl-D-glutamate--2, 6-diaminopimelate ligase [Thermoflexales bacterium]|nr:UDP-N-acetylmuramoyl-L-alanyl-D-glutamate--2, 6-diaminopimelate ligase [Thermoflexales bacterium]
MKLSQLIAALPALDTPPQSDPDITLITTDSRQVIPGALFVAYPGVSVDGHRFIAEAVARGAAVIMGEQELTTDERRQTIVDDGAPLSNRSPWSVISGRPYLKVRDGREAFAWLSAAWHGYPARQLIMIGVTGTDGKTTTSNLIHSILMAAGLKAGLISTVNAVIGDRVLDTGLHTTTPNADEVQRYLAEMVAAGMTHCVLESTSHGLEQHRVTGCEFDLAVVTNITHEHLDVHGSLEAYRAAKGMLFTSLATAVNKGLRKAAVLNNDDSSNVYLREWIETKANCGVGCPEMITYAIHAAAQWNAFDIDYRTAAIHFNTLGAGHTIEIATPLVGEFNIANCLAAIAATVAGLGVDPQAARSGIATLSGIPGRIERIDEGQNFTAIVDFAHTPNALDRSIAAARTMTEGQVIVAFGCAGLRDREKRTLMGEVAGRAADKIIVTAEDPRTESLTEIMAVTAQALIAQGRVEGVDFWRVPDRGEALARACSLAKAGDVVMACGKGHEQSMCFGEIEYPWDDREAMRAALRGLPLRTLPTATT